MLKNYLITALRSIAKQKLYSGINVFGLALGIACCVLLGLFIVDEVTFDRIHTDGDRIFRVARVSLNPDASGDKPTPYMPIPAGPALQADMPEVEHYVRFKKGTHLGRHGEVVAEEQVLFGDPDALTVFSFPFVAGTAEALRQPSGVVLSTTTAQKYFGDADPIGQPFDLRVDGAFYPFVVTAVVEVPSNSTVRFDVLASFERLFELYERMERSATQFNVSGYLTYIQLREGAHIASVEAKMPAFIETHYGEHIERMREHGYWQQDGLPLTYAFQPLPTIHLDPSFHPGITPPSNPLYSQILGGIALAILLIACINFMTLAIGRSARRAREVGVRKSVGAYRGQLVGQFLGEALLMSTLALALGLALAALFLPTFNTLTGKALSLDILFRPLSLAGLVGLTLVIGLAAGSYPALLLARLRPVESLKDRVRLGGSGSLARGLVVVQFALSVFLLTGALVLGAQMRFLQNQDLGFDRAQAAVISVSEAGHGAGLARLRTALAGNSAVTAVTGASISFGRGTSSYGFQHEGEELEIVVYGVESNFVETMGMDLVAGRDFDPTLATDSTDAVIINEALVQRLGWANPVGQRMPDGFSWGDIKAPLIVGVVRDFNFRSLHTAVDPALLMLYEPGDIGVGIARLAPGQTRAGLDALEAAWTGIAPELPFDYGFLEDDLAAFYEDEARWAQIVRWATLFALLVACLGLFGLASLAVTQRTKEIGIRKVLGASVADVAVLLSKGFATLVVVAVLIAAPLAWLAAEEWLGSFAYRIDLGPGLFLLAGGLALVIALVTVSYHAVRTATADPVRALRHE